MNFCTNCGSKLIDGKCEKCGYVSEKSTSSFSLEQTLNKATQTINEFAGEKGSVELKLRHLFSGVFKKHTADEAETIFISGTSKTTPKTKDIISDWPQPWLFARVFLMFALAFLALFICFDNFENLNALPGLVFIGAMMVPLSLIVFFMEINAPRNISFFECLTTFFVGGSFSIVISLLLYSLADTIEGYIGALIVAIIEETAKLVTIAYYIKRYKKSTFVLNGMLLGACVGAGFATFETAGYILKFGLVFGKDIMYEVLGLRAFLAPGSHIVWGAIIGAAIMLAKRNNDFKLSFLSDKKVVIFTLLCIGMHAIWDMPIDIDYYLVQVLMTVCAWIILLVLLSVGLKEISKIRETE